MVSLSVVCWFWLWVVMGCFGLVIGVVWCVVMFRVVGFRLFCLMGWWVLVFCLRIVLVGFGLVVWMVVLVVLRRVVSCSGWWCVLKVVCRCWFRVRMVWFGLV